ncbi:hypothetical protein MKK69_20680 [Methylobacterium sp. J-026]|uniref:hypothetical protein n=1 Tax=Methylobacterium sp. J-026 TaxID=2836624 RepID=UPI001FB926AD|nr:hypothetical protein [Methylobacterium sp. J-026]MCJ2136437.1 hypothetical protein [Methylobacterium sp. J-026]
MPVDRTSNSLSKRLAKLESAICPPQHRTVRHFAIKGPKGLPRDAAVAFLRECGHDIRDDECAIIRVMVAPGYDLPLKDITDRCGR